MYSENVLGKVVSESVPADFVEPLVFFVFFVDFFSDFGVLDLEDFDGKEGDKKGSLPGSTLIGTEMVSEDSLQGEKKQLGRVMGYEKREEREFGAGYEVSGKAND